MSDYAVVPGGSLKFKGDDGKKKKKKKSHSTEDRSKIAEKEERKDKERVREKDARRELAEASRSASPTVASGTASPAPARRMTEAEKRFEEVQRKRREERARKMGAQTHKDRVNEFNSKLDKLSEHHDMPKIGPG